MVGKQLSHRIVGPVYAFEKFIDNYIQGNYYKLKLRKGDEFPELEDLAEKIARELQTVEDSHMIPLLPEGEKDSEVISQNG
jgi:signal peptidase II